MAEGRAPVQGRGAVEELIKGLMAAQPQKVSLTVAEVEGRGDLAFKRGSYTLSPAGITGNYIEVWQKEPDGQWRIIRNVWNTNTDTTGGTTTQASSLPDSIKADPGHYKVEAENDVVRVLRVKYGPGEKSVMHTHPASCTIVLTNASFTFTAPDANRGKDTPAQSGQVLCADGGPHLPENTGKAPAEMVVVELKGRQTFTK